MLGTGSPLKIQLERGTHVITVIVDDGTDQVENNLTLIVRKEEESPGFGWVVALAAISLVYPVARRNQERIVTYGTT
jgi:hypothetical protein